MPASPTWYLVLLGLVGLERIAELVVSARNIAWAKVRGGVEYGLGHYPVMVVLHLGLLVGCAVEAFHRPFLPWLGWPMLVVVLAAQGLRWWCIATLGHRWNTRIVVVPGMPLVTAGPYGRFRHPNYVAVVAEGIALPLVHSAWVTAVVFTVLNGALLAVRISAEDAALHADVVAGTDDPAAPPPLGVTDLIVAGAGPAGLGTALYARRAGLGVTVLDPRAPPIDKACGEGLMPGAVRALAELNVQPEGRPFRGIRYLSGERSAQALFRSGAGLGVRRTTLHRALLDAATAAGVEVLRRPVGQVIQDERTVRAGGLTGSWLVAADGLHSPLRAQLGLNGPRARHRRFGLRRHYPIAPWTDLVEVYWTAGGEAYVTPVGPGLVGVALLGGGGRFDDRLADFPLLVERLSGTGVQVPVGRGAAIGPVPGAGPVLGAGPLRQRVRHRVAGRVLLVGDAAGYVDALTGEGIAVSLRSAELLVECLVAGRPDDYERAWRRASRRYRWLTRTLVSTTRVPLARRAIVPAAAGIPKAFSAVVNGLAS